MQEDPAIQRLHCGGRMMETLERPDRPAVPGFPPVDRCLVMGILNVTPDSFSDGSRYLAVDAAVGHGIRLLRDGADMVDVGGESTRPNSRRVDAFEERRRVLPVVRELVAAGVPVSVDTMRASVAEAAIASGARVINDVSGGLADRRMVDVVRSAGVPYVVMHWRGHSDRMSKFATYSDVVTEVTQELQARLDTLERLGIAGERIIMDPGLGFAKRPEHDWALLRGLDQLHTLGRPLMVGASRKSFLGALAEQSFGDSRAPSDRDALTASVTALAASQGASLVRVHDVASSRDAVAVAEAWHGGPVRVRGEET